jgi:hypothetical protein
MNWAVVCKWSGEWLPWITHATTCLVPDDGWATIKTRPLRPVPRELAGQAHLEGGNDFTYGLLHAAEAARAERAEHDLPSAWKWMRERKNTAWLTN